MSGIAIAIELPLTSNRRTDLNHRTAIKTIISTHHHRFRNLHIRINIITTTNATTIT